MNGSRGRAWKAFHGKGMSSSSLADGQGLSLSDLPKVGDAPPAPSSRRSQATPVYPSWLH